VSTDAPR